MKTRRETLEFLLEDKVKLATVSGIFTTKVSIIELVDRDFFDIDLITTKSYQVLPNHGNREPIIAEQSVGNFGNAVGLRNPGMEQGHLELSELRKRRNLRCPLIVSLSANSIDDFITLVKRFEDVADMLELNFSCPHASPGYGSSIGAYPKVVREYMEKIRGVTRAILIPKLTPNADDIGKIAVTAIEAGADGISAINTVGPVEYIEPHTQKTILYNPKAHKGGKSGEWIRDIAQEKVREIRDAIGDGIPIIGMGGITTGKDVKRMRDAGANVFGLGSVFARVSMDKRRDFVAFLKKDIEFGTNLADLYVSRERLAEYKPHRINKITEKDENLRIFELDGTMDYDASQFAFLWVPDVGEKPFSIARGNPLTFVVRKQEYVPGEKGLVTHALFGLKEGEEMMVRGAYGADIRDNLSDNAYIIAGGTGIAVVPKLVQRLSKQEKSVTVYHGVTSPQQGMFEEEIERYGKYRLVVDPSPEQKGEVIRVMQRDLERRDLSNSCFYNIGPVHFMDLAIKTQQGIGIDPAHIYASIETNNMCGIGMCGECECGGRLTCQQGTFFSKRYLDEHKINILEFGE